MKFSEVIFDKIIYFGFILLFFLTPFLFTPFNYELFEFNKMIFVYAVTLVIAFGWLGKFIYSPKKYFAVTPVNIFMVLYIGAALLSTMFSLHPYTSIWGYYSRFHGGLMSLTAYAVLFFALTNNIDKIKAVKLLKTVVMAISLVSAYGILEHFGIDDQYWIQDVKNRVFSTLGQPNWLGAVISAIIFIPLALMFQEKQKIKSLLYAGLYFIYLFCLIFTNSKSAILAFFLGLVVLSLLLFFKKNAIVKQKKLFLLALPATIIIYLALGSNTYSYLKKAPLWLNLFNDKSIVLDRVNRPDSQSNLFISESSDIRKVVWQGALAVFRHNPIFGTGPETFGYAYYNFRPTSHNLLSEWDFLYNKAHNEFLDILATQGLIGFSAYMLFILAFLFIGIKILVYKKTDEKNFILSAAILIGYSTILITNFFGFSVVMTGIYFYLLPAFFLIINHKVKVKEVRSPSLPKAFFTQLLPIKQFFMILFFLFFIFLELKLVNIWRADFHYAKGEKLNQSGYMVSGLKEIQQAIELNPYPALYHGELVETSAKIALAYFQNEASDSAEIIDQLKNLALVEAEISLALNPVHLNLYKSAAKTYIYLHYLDPQYRHKAIDSLEQAGRLAPTDAKILYNLGILYEQENNLDKAIEIWQKGADLKPNYLEIYLQLTEALITNKQYSLAQERISYIVNHITPADTRVLKLQQQVQDLNK